MAESPYSPEMKHFAPSYFGGVAMVVQKKIIENQPVKPLLPPKIRSKRREGPSGVSNMFQRRPSEKNGFNTMNTDM